MLKFGISVTGLDEAREKLEPGKWLAQLEQAHKLGVFGILRHLMRTTPVDTGRARSGWLPILRKWGMFDYKQDFMDTSLIGGRAPGPDAQEHEDAGTFTDEPFATTIVNNVQYVEALNEGNRTKVKDLSRKAQRFYWAGVADGSIPSPPPGPSGDYVGFIDRAMERGKGMMEEAFQQIIDRAAEKGGIETVKTSAELLRERFPTDDA